MYLDGIKLDLTAKHMGALHKGKTISLPIDRLGKGRDIMLTADQFKKAQRAMQKGSGMRLSMSPDQVEFHKGAGLWDEVKDLIVKHKEFIIEKGVPAFTTAVASSHPVMAPYILMTPAMQMAVEDIINEFIEGKSPSTLDQRLKMLKKYLTAPQIKQLKEAIMAIGRLAMEGGAVSIDVAKMFQDAGIKKLKTPFVEMKGRGRPRTLGGRRGIRPVMGHESAEPILVQRGEIDPTAHSRGSALEFEGSQMGGKITLADVGKALRKVGEKVIGKKATRKVESFGKKAGKTLEKVAEDVQDIDEEDIKKGLKKAEKYITAKKGGLATDLIDYGIPAATAAVVGGITGAATGGVGGVVGSAAGSKLGKEVIAPALHKLTGAGCGCGGALKPAGDKGMGLMPAGMGLMPAGMGLKPAGAGIYMPASKVIVRHGKGVKAKVMVPHKYRMGIVKGGSLMPDSSSAGTGNYIPITTGTPAFYTPAI